MSSTSAIQKSLGIVIPVYNEADNILQTLERISEYTPVSTVVSIVADSEEDNSFDVLSQFSSSLVTLRPMINGYGSGALNAIKWGLHHSPESAILVTMADHSDDMSSLRPMWEHYQRGSSVVCASRYMSGGRQIGGPWLKSKLSRLAGLSLHFLSGLPTKDVTNSFKLYSREIIDAIEIESQGGFEVGMEIVVKAWTMGYRVTEVPTTWTDRTFGQSRFQLLAWLPSYLRWYWFCLRRSKFSIEA